MSKQYIRTQQLANRGESFVENILSGFALAHKVDQSKDLGLDFICEWVHGEKPTQLLFGIQVKTRSEPRITPAEPLVSHLNGLDQFNISFDGDNFNQNTLDYWEGFNFPVFVFLVHMNGSVLDCYYKRYTPIIHNSAKPTEEHFYKVWKENQFLAFIDRTGADYPKTGGFCRDLFFDHLRCQHNKGMLSGVDPAQLGLSGYRDGALYEGVYSQYASKIKSTFEKYKKYIDQGLL